MICARVYHAQYTCAQFPSLFNLNIKRKPKIICCTYSHMTSSESNRNRLFLFRTEIYYVFENAPSIQSDTLCWSIELLVLRKRKISSKIGREFWFVSRYHFRINLSFCRPIFDYYINKRHFFAPQETNMKHKFVYITRLLICIDHFL